MEMKALIDDISRRYQMQLKFEAMSNIKPYSRNYYGQCTLLKPKDSFVEATPHLDFLKSFDNRGNNTNSKYNNLKAISGPISTKITINRKAYKTIELTDKCLFKVKRAIGNSCQNLYANYLNNTLRRTEKKLLFPRIQKPNMIKANHINIISGCLNGNHSKNPTWTSTHVTTDDEISPWSHE